MKYLILILCGVLLASCGEVPRSTPDIAGPLTTDAPTTGATNAGQAHAIVDVSNAVAGGDHKSIVAAKTELKLEDQHANTAQLSPFYPLAVLFIMIAVFLAYIKDYEAAGGALVVAGGAIYGTLAVSAAIAHGGFIVTVGIIAGVAFLIYRHRAYLEAEAKVVAKDAETAALALAHAVSHINYSTAISHGIADVDNLFWSAVLKAKSEFEILARKVHLIKPAPTPTTTATVTVTETKAP